MIAPIKLKRRLRCPKCRKAPDRLVEFMVGTSAFRVLDDGAARDAEGWHEPGGYYRLDAACGCGHRWRIKGEIQVTGVDAATLAARPAAKPDGVR